MWDDGLVVYDARSDEVHRFDTLSGEIFEQLRAAPRLLADLIEQMSQRLEVVADQELSELVAEILRALSDKDLVAEIG